MSYHQYRDNDTFTALQHHDEYYLSGGDLFFLIEQYHFRVHRYFFERESNYFKAQLATPASPGVPRQGTSESSAIVLENVKADDFAKLLWVFYNPKYSLYKAPVSDWVRILDLAYRWGFQEVKSLVVRELEKLQMPVIDRIVVYHKYEIDRFLLTHRYTALVEREETLALEESTALGLETSWRIFTAREHIRAPRTAKGPGPTPIVLPAIELPAFIKEHFEIPDPFSPNMEPPPPMGPVSTMSTHIPKTPSKETSKEPEKEKGKGKGKDGDKKEDEKKNEEPVKGAPNGDAKKEAGATSSTTGGLAAPNRRFRLIPPSPTSPQPLLPTALPVPQLALQVSLDKTNLTTEMDLGEEMVPPTPPNVLNLLPNLVPPRPLAETRERKEDQRLLGVEEDNVKDTFTDGDVDMRVVFDELNDTKPVDTVSSLGDQKHDDCYDPNANSSDSFERPSSPFDGSGREVEGSSDAGAPPIVGEEGTDMLDDAASTLSTSTFFSSASATAGPGSFMKPDNGLPSVNLAEASVASLAALPGTGDDGLGEEHTPLTREERPLTTDDAETAQAVADDVTTHTHTAAPASPEQDLLNLPAAEEQTSWLGLDRPSFNATFSFDASFASLNTSREDFHTASSAGGYDDDDDFDSLWGEGGETADPVVNAEQEVAPSVAEVAPKDTSATTGEEMLQAPEQLAATEDLEQLATPEGPPTPREEDTTKIIHPDPKLSSEPPEKVQPKLSIDTSVPAFSVETTTTNDDGRKTVVDALPAANESSQPDPASVDTSDDAKVAPAPVEPAAVFNPSEPTPAEENAWGLDDLEELDEQDTVQMAPDPQTATSPAVLESKDVSSEDQLKPADAATSSDDHPTKLGQASDATTAGESGTLTAVDGTSPESDLQENSNDPITAPSQGADDISSEDKAAVPPVVPGPDENPEPSPKNSEQVVLDSEKGEKDEDQSKVEQAPTDPAGTTPQTVESTPAVTKEDVPATPAVGELDHPEAAVTVDNKADSESGAKEADVPVVVDSERVEEAQDQPKVEDAPPDLGVVPPPAESTPAAVEEDGSVKPAAEVLDCPDTAATADNKVTSESGAKEADVPSVVDPEKVEKAQDQLEVENTSDLPDAAPPAESASVAADEDASVTPATGKSDQPDAAVMVDDKVTSESGANESNVPDVVNSEKVEDAEGQPQIEDVPADATGVTPAPAESPSLAEAKDDSVTPIPGNPDHPDAALAIDDKKTSHEEPGQETSQTTSNAVIASDLVEQESQPAPVDDKLPETPDPLAGATPGLVESSPTPAADDGSKTPGAEGPDSTEAAVTLDSSTGTSQDNAVPPEQPSEATLPASNENTSSTDEKVPETSGSSPVPEPMSTDPARVSNDESSPPAVGPLTTTPNPADASAASDVAASLGSNDAGEPKSHAAKGEAGSGQATPKPLGLDTSPAETSEVDGSTVDSGASQPTDGTATVSVGQASGEDQEAEKEITMSGEPLVPQAEQAATDSLEAQSANVEEVKVVTDADVEGDKGDNPPRSAGTDDASKSTPDDTTTQTPAVAAENPGNPSASSDPTASADADDEAGDDAPSTTAEHQDLQVDTSVAGTVEDDAMSVSTVTTPVNSKTQANKKPKKSNKKKGRKG